MGRLFSPTFWFQTFMSTLLTMFCIYIIKKISSAYNIPVVSTIANEV